MALPAEAEGDEVQIPCRCLDGVTGLAGEVCKVQGALNCTISSPANLATPSKHRPYEALLAVRERWDQYHRSRTV